MHLFFAIPYLFLKHYLRIYQKKKTDYQKGYEDGENLVVKHVNLDGRSKAKEYIQKFTKQNRTAGFDLSEAMGNIRGAIKILNNRIIK